MSKKKFKNPVVNWIDHRLGLFSFSQSRTHQSPTPKEPQLYLELWKFGRYYSSYYDSNWNSPFYALYTSC